MNDKTFDLAAFVAAQFDEHATVATATARALGSSLQALVDECWKCLVADKKILVFGNGGSAADAQHLAAELCVRYEADRRALPAIALTTDTSILTAAANDLGFAQVFARQIEALGRPGDLAVAISTSGRSENVLAGLRQAGQQGMARVGLTGGDGGAMRDLTDHCLVVPAALTSRIQEMHILIVHILCGAIDRKLAQARA